MRRFDGFVVALLALACPFPAARAATAAEPAGRPAQPGRDAGISGPILLDDFESSAAWTAMPASGVEMKLSAEPGPHGNALRVDFDFKSGGGYAVLHRKLSLDLPENYRFEFQIRGETAPQNLEFKLVDESGENVWWCNRINHDYPREWTADRIRRRQVSFAWGPRGGGELRHAAAIEFAVTSGSGGRGTVWLDDLTLVPMAMPGLPPPPVASASSAAPGHEPALAADTGAETWWESLASDPLPSWTLELGTSLEFGGLVLDWLPGRHAPDYAIEFDDGDERWRTVREVHAGDGGRDWLDLPESETRRVRVRTLAKAAETVALVGARVMPLEWSSTPERFLMAVAKDQPRGHYPRAFLDEQVYWTVVGADGDPEEGLLDEDGRLETGRGQFSLEPFLLTERGLKTWADGRTEHALAEGSLPIPTATRFVDSLALSVTAFARPAGQGGGHSELVARYRVKDLSHRPRDVTLFLSLRPFQVNPPSQFLNIQGGPARIRSLERSGAVVNVNRERMLAVTPEPASFYATSFDEGDDLVTALASSRAPARDSVVDATGRASGAFRWRLELPAGGEREVDAHVSLEPPHANSSPPSPRWAATSTSTIAGWQRVVTKEWEDALGSFRLEAGGSGHDVAATLRAQLGYVLVNRDRFGIQPGSRSYERSWIRDGSLTCSALLRAGMTPPVTAFLQWYADHQYADGKVPCCVDKRGSDPVPEHDSHGELVFLAAEYLRLTGDRATAERVWPHVRAAVAYLDTLREQRRTPEWRTRERAAFFGLLPPSISHEGYSAKPMHSYWDDLFALRGYKDGAWLAGQLGHADDARWMAASGEQFAHDFAAAAAAAMREHGIDFVPGCSDLGDFDATSTTIAMTPVQAQGVLPDSALVRTFERYWDFFTRRRDGLEKWDAYTPYELRNVGAFVRLGWRERASALLDWFMRDRRPAGWREWAEVVDREPRHARFIGDMPHTWVGTDFVRSVMEMLAYERESDSTLVIGAGIPEAWLAGGGVSVKGLHTRWGTLGYVLRKNGERLLLTLDPSALRTPPGGIEFAPPLPERNAWSQTPLRVDRDVVRLDADDGRWRWRPTKQAPTPPRSLEWGPAVNRAGMVSDPR